MNIQTPFTRAQINLMLEEPFGCKCRIPGIIQDEIGKRLSAGIPPHLRKGARQSGPTNQEEAGKRGGARKAAMAVAHRAALAPRVLALTRQGMSCRQIEATTGIGRNLVLRILKEAKQ